MTMVEVDRDDPAFADPTKFVGPVYAEGQAQALAAEKGWPFRRDGESWRRVVPSPLPRQIYQIDPIRVLLDRDVVVICAGGGGVRWFPEMTASFILFTVIIGLVAPMSEGELTESFVAGARDLLGVALIIGIARGITVIMNNGQITDTVLHWAEVALGDVGQGRSPWSCTCLVLPLSFRVPSSSGVATVDRHGPCDLTQ